MTNLLSNLKKGAISSMKWLSNFFRHRDALYTWFFTDVAFTILPIIVLCLINKASNISLNSVLLSPEWSFASIIFFGTSVKYLIDVREYYRNQPPFALQIGTQLYILLLIASVFSLSLMMLRERGTDFNVLFLATLQIALFILGLFTTFIGATSLQRAIRYSKITLETKALNSDKKNCLELLEASLIDARDKTDAFRYVLEASKGQRIFSISSFEKSQVWDERSDQTIRHLLESLETTVSQARKTYDERALFKTQSH